MTTPEHTLVGIHCAMMLGLHRSYGWRAIAVAGIASNLPDWDGLPMLIDMERFEIGHRVWGHNVFSIAVASVLFSLVQWRFDWLGWMAQRFSGNKTTATELKQEVSELKVNGQAPAGETETGQSQSSHRQSGHWQTQSLLVLFIVALAVQLIHLPCDMVVSGGNGLSNWPIRPWWPMDNTAYVYPMIPWGDVGPTLILMIGVIVAAKLQRQLAAISAGSILTLVVYLILRSGLLWTELPV